MSVFHSVPGVPCTKMERFAGVDTQTCASPHLKLQLHAVVQRTSMKEGFWGEAIVCLCRTHVNLIPVINFTPAFLKIVVIRT
ncbi:MAG: hypothetical protein JWR09_3306 [Mucilaginibacter sp.]|nr:hypothetical protein [Mucilaginibacter sp.]